MNARTSDRTLPLGPAVAVPRYRRHNLRDQRAVAWPALPSSRGAAAPGRSATVAALTAAVPASASTRRCGSVVPAEMGLRTEPFQSSWVRHFESVLPRGEAYAAEPSNMGGSCAAVVLAFPRLAAFLEEQQGHAEARYGIGPPPTEGGVEGHSGEGDDR